MKKMNKLMLLCLSVFAFSTWTACSDDDFTPGPAAEGQGLYFSAEQSSEITVNETEGTFTVDVLRSQTAGAAQAELIVTVAAGAESLFTIPATADFADGENKTTLTIAYQNLERDVPYQITLEVKEPTPYGLPSFAFTVTCPLVWEVVSTNATLIDQMFAPFEATNVEITELTVEKHPDQNKYRFRSPYDNSYFNYLFGMDVLDAAFETPYIVLDGETYPGNYFISAVKLGWKMVNGEGPKADAEWITFGSMAYNTDGDPAQYPLGTYNENTKTFDFGVIFHNIDGVGVYPFNGMTLSL